MAFKPTVITSNSRVNENQTSGTVGGSTLSNKHTNDDTGRKNPCMFCDKTGHNIYQCRLFSARLHKKDIISPGRKVFAMDVSDLHSVDKNHTKADVDETGTSHRASQLDSKDPKCSMAVPVYVSSLHDPDKEVLVYAVLDTQSDTTFISEETSQKLKIKARPARL